MAYPTLQLATEDERWLRRIERRALQLSRAPRPSPVAPSRTVRRDWLRTWHFPSEEAAELWNFEWERVGRYPGHLHAGLVSIDGAPISDRLLSLLARVGASMLCDEVRAGGLYPHAQAGWSYEMQLRHIHRRSRFSWQRDSLVVELTGRVLDSADAERWASATACAYPLDRLPELAPVTLTRIAPPPIRERW